jgi:hypothetical protein
MAKGTPPSETEWFSLILIGIIAIGLALLFTYMIYNFKITAP